MPKRIPRKKSDVSVGGHSRENGAVKVKPHKRTAGNTKTGDNFSEKGNINPYTKKRGTN